MLAPEIESEIAELAAGYGEPRRVVAGLDGGLFSPLTLPDRYGEVCMVVRRPNGKLLTAIKTFYPSGAFRLLTGGVGHGEPIAAALLREAAEETSLDLAVRRFLAVIEYWMDGGRGPEVEDGTFGRRPSSPSLQPLAPGPARFVTFAFLLDEIGGTLAVQDEAEQIGAFREIGVAELPALAATLESVPDTFGADIDGSWRDWGRFRAILHRVVYDLLRDEGSR
jgi:8-oxo-dGTP pyrophosphatase MutT (NUDIX family)